jgi:hypothetical protein
VLSISNASVGLAGAISQFHAVVGNITQTSRNRLPIQCSDTTGNVLAASVSAGQINTTGNVLAASVSAGQINTTGNVLAASVSAGQINTTGNVLAASVSAGQINTTGNVLAAGGVLNALTVNGTTTRAGATVDSNYQIYKPTANVSIQANVDVSRVIVAPTKWQYQQFLADVTLPNVST